MQTKQTSSADLDALITDHISLVGHLVRGMIGRLPAQVSRDDLTSAGMTALVQAAHAYDGARGVPFTAYATTRIRGALLDELRGIDWASRSVRRRARDLDDARGHLAGALGRPATNEEVASSLGLSVEEVVANRDDVARASVTSFEALTETVGDSVLPSTGLTPEQVVELGEQVSYLTAAVAELPERLRTVVSDYFFSERPMSEIAADLDVTESRVSQMRAEALSLLKDALNSALDPQLLTPHTRPDGCAARRRDAYYAAVVSRQAAVARSVAAASRSTASLGAFDQTA